MKVKNYLESANYKFRTVVAPELYRSGRRVSCCVMSTVKGRATTKDFYLGQRSRAGRDRITQRAIVGSEARMRSEKSGASRPQFSKLSVLWPRIVNRATRASIASGLSDLFLIAQRILLCYHSGVQTDVTGAVVIQSLGFDAGQLDHLAPFLGFLGDELAKIGW